MEAVADADDTLRDRYFHIEQAVSLQETSARLLCVWIVRHVHVLWRQNSAVWQDSKELQRYCIHWYDDGSGSFGHGQTAAQKGRRSRIFEPSSNR